MAKRMRPEEDPESDEENLAVHEKDVAGAGQEGTGIRALPRKRFYRQRAHANPFSDHELSYPASPDAMDWSAHYPKLQEMDESRRTPKFLDVGCGFGGLLMDLAPLYPDTLMLGMEIRVQVTQFVADKILALRSQHATGPQERHTYNNISVLRANAMKFLPNFFHKASLEKMFFLFPDPHFKARKHKARIISPTLLAEYAYVLAPQGRLYIATDVHDLFLWMQTHLDQCELFRRLDEEDQVTQYVRGSTEEGKKVARNQGQKWLAIYERV